MENGSESESLKVWYRKEYATQGAKHEFERHMSMPMTLDNMEYIIRYFFVDQDVMADWLETIRAIRIIKDNINDGNEIRKIIVPVGHDEIELTAENIDEVKKNLDYLFRIDANIQYAKKITYEVDPTSRVLFMSGSQEQEPDLSWYMIRPEIFTYNFQYSGTYGCIYGSPRSGKTDFACKLMEIFGKKKYQIITNIKINNAPNYIHYTTLISDTIRYMFQYDKWVMILDETGKDIPKRRALSDRNINFENLARFIGKLGGRVILITHSFERDVPTLIQDWTTEKYLKKSKKRLWVDLEKDEGIKMHKLFGDVEPTTLEFITEDISGIAFDIDIKALFEKISMGNGKRQKEIALKFIENKKKKKCSPEEIADMVKEKARRQSVTEACREVAKKVKLSIETVRSYYYNFSKL